MATPANSPVRFVVNVDDREHAATVLLDTRAPGQASRVTVGERTFEVRAAADGKVLVRSLDGGKQHLVTLDHAAKPTSAAIAGIAIDFEVLSAQQAAMAAALREAGGGDAGSRKLKAPMPGRVVKILVAEGDSVERGAPVVIVEAMKMENEMYAPLDGTVARIAVAEGDTVDSGALLCEFAAPEGT